MQMDLKVYFSRPIWPELKRPNLNLTKLNESRAYSWLFDSRGHRDSGPHRVWSKSGKQIHTQSGYLSCSQLMEMEMKLAHHLYYEVGKLVIQSLE